MPHRRGPVCSVAEKNFWNSRTKASVRRSQSMERSRLWRGQDPRSLRARAGSWTTADSGPLRVPDSPEATLQNHVAAGSPHNPIVSASACLTFVECAGGGYSEGANPCL